MDQFKQYERRDVVVSF